MGLLAEPARASEPFALPGGSGRGRTSTSSAPGFPAATPTERSRRRRRSDGLLPGNPGAEDDDVAPAPGSARQGERLARPRRLGEQPHRLPCQGIRRYSRRPPPAARGTHAELLLRPLTSAHPEQASSEVERPCRRTGDVIAPAARRPGAAAVTSISTSQPGSTSPATCMVERAGARLRGRAEKFAIGGHHAGKVHPGLARRRDQEDAHHHDVADAQPMLAEGASICRAPSGSGWRCRRSAAPTRQAAGVGDVGTCR